MNLRQFVTQQLSNKGYKKIRDEYKAAIYALILYFLTKNMSVDDAELKAYALIGTYFLKSYNLGIKNGGSGKGNKEWLRERITAETIFATALFTELLRNKKNVDAKKEAQARADNYALSLDGIYNVGKVTGAEDEFLTFLGEDGTPPEWPCKECEELKGQTHPASWWINNDFIPRPGNTNFTCGSYNCQHKLFYQDGTQFTY